MLRRRRSADSNVVVVSFLNADIRRARHDPPMFAASINLWTVLIVLLIVCAIVWLVLVLSGRGRRGP